MTNKTHACNKDNLSMPLRPICAQALGHVDITIQPGQFEHFHRLWTSPQTQQTIQHKGKSKKKKKKKSQPRSRAPTQACLQSHLAIPDGHFSRISSGTTGYPEQRGIMNSSKRFREYYFKKKARTLILVLLRRFISIKFICEIDSSALYYTLLVGFVVGIMAIE